MMVDERIAERRAEVRRDRQRRRLRRTILVASLLVLAVAAFVVERSPLVALAEVRVSGTNRLNPEDVRDAAGLEAGTSTLRLPLGAARERVEALPLVRSAEVRRVDPLTVLLEVTERAPVAVIVRGDEAVLVDEDGVILAPGAEPDLPRIRLQEGSLPEPGEDVGASPAAANAHAAMRGLPGALRSRIAAYVARAADEVDLKLVGGVVVRFGRADRIDEKARALGAVLEEVGRQPVEVIDVRAPSRPVVVPAS